MKTKKNEFSKTYVALFDPTTKPKATDLLPMRYLKDKMSILFLTSIAITLFYSHSNAQVSGRELERAKPVTKLSASIYGNERNDISNIIKTNSSTAAPLEFQSTEIKAVVANQDYFAPDLLLDDNDKTKIPGDHTIQTARYNNKSITIDGQSQRNLTVYEIQDQFTLRDSNTDGVYSYDNTYYLLRDATGNNIATVYYIDRTIGFLRSEYKFVVKATSLPPSSLLVAPNPAKSIVNFTFEAEKPSQASLSIIDINGRTIDTVFTNKQFQNGKHTIQHHLTLPAGTYLIRFNIEGLTPVTQKLIVQ